MLINVKDKQVTGTGIRFVMLHFLVCTHLHRNSRTTSHGSEVTIADITISDVLKSQPKLTRLFHDLDKYSSKQSISLSRRTETAGF